MSFHRAAGNPRSTGLACGRQTVTTGGTAVALSTTSNPCIQLEITAETDNTGLVVVGDSTVVAALATRKGTPLNAGDTLTLYSVDLKDVYLDATVNTDGVTFTGVGAT
jgi:hypothetical protein